MPATLAARGIVQGLLAAGVRHAVLCPGSRSAPLAYALHAADAAGALRLHVRIDERVAAFTALGIGRSGGAPAAVVTTSGTAVANLFPAVLEAHHAAVPLVVLTADRPSRLRGTWANQTSDLQAGLFGRAVRRAVDLDDRDGDEFPEGSPDGPAEDWAALAAGMCAAAAGLGRARPGPVHLNVGFDEPLTPADTAWRPVTGGSARLTNPVTVRPHVLAGGPATVVVAGDGAGPQARALAETAGWPLLAEPTSGSRGGPCRVPAYRLLLDGPLAAAVERVVVLGRPTLSRPVTALLARDDVEVVLVGDAVGPGPSREVHRVPAGVPAPGPAPVEWLRRWTTAGRAAMTTVDAVLDEHERRTGTPAGPRIAAEVVASTGPGTGLVVAASNPVRDADLAAGDVRALFAVANRGLSGIDGTVSTAAGASFGSQAPVRALVGDLAFLHDANALLLGPGEPVPRVQVVVVNDGGGGIFGLLEHGGPRFAAAFERVFGTPQRVALAALCAAHGVAHRRVGSTRELDDVLGAGVPAGISVVEVPVDRSEERGLDSRIRAAATP